MTTTEPFYKELKAHRESQGIEISEISERTKINPKYFNAIEKGDFSVLPNVYMRLFLRSYAAEIGADTDKVLADFEVHTTGTIQEKYDLKFQSASSDESKEEMSFLGDFTPAEFQKKLIMVATAVVILILLFWFVGKLTKEQTDETGPVEVIQNETEETNTPEGAIILFSPLPEAFLLEDVVVYAEEKKIRDRTLSTALDIQPPFNFTLISKAQTKVNISSKNEIFLNGIITSASRKEISFEDTLRFDLWSAQHVTVLVNGLDISPLITDEDIAIRASIIADGSLSVMFYNH